MLRLRPAAPLIALLAILSAGCEEDLLPPLHHDYPFSLYGVLNPLADTQFVYVFPIEPTLTTGTAGPIDAWFTSRDLATDEVRAWRYSVVVD